MPFVLHLVGAAGLGVCAGRGFQPWGRVTQEDLFADPESCTSLPVRASNTAVIDPRAQTEGERVGPRSGVTAGMVLREPMSGQKGRERPPPSAVWSHGALTVIAGSSAHNGDL